jgi:hypothetical protein
MYESAHLITSKTVSGFPEFPIPAAFPDFPGHRLMLRYLTSYAEYFQLDGNIRFGADVRSLERIGSGEPAAWRVTTHAGETLYYQYVVIATGLQWTPRCAGVPVTFGGEIMHSSRYGSARQLTGKRVLVIGSGNSGVDIACDAAESAQSASLSMRRGNWVVPKYLFGVPADSLSGGGSRLPMRLRQIITEVMLRVLVGDLTRFGLPKPRHRIYEIPPIINSELLEKLGHGDLRVRPAVRHFDDRLVTFVDGTSAEFDLVILATGYEAAFPLLHGPDLAPAGGAPDLFIHTFPRELDDIAVIGLPGGEGGGFRAMSLQSELAAEVFRRSREAPRSLDAFRALKQTRPDLSGGIDFAANDRTAFAVSAQVFCRQLCSLRDRFRRREI